MTGEEEHAFIGIHILGEMYGIDAELLNNSDVLGGALTEGINRSGATLCHLQTKQFEPQGITMLALLSESHASVHTYPDQGALFFDAFTCGVECQPEQIAKALEAALKPKRCNLKKILRGKTKEDHETNG